MSRRGKNAVVIAIALFATVIAPTGAAGQPSVDVVNGDEVAAGTFPYLAWVYYSDDHGSRACSGSVVASNVILTAAHCVLPPGFGATLDPANFRVVTGNVHPSAEPHTVSAVTSLAVAPSFRTEAPFPTPLAGDAAVLVLAHPVSSPPVRLATSREWSVGTPVEFAGWGQTASTSGASDVLRVGKGSVQSDAYCATRFGPYDPAALICSLDTPNYHYAPCHGDSGGPLLITAPGTAGEPLEIGIDSFGALDCSPEAPSFFTRVDAIAPWVAAVIAANPPIPVPALAPPIDLTPREPRPRITAGKARTKATAALRRGLGGRFVGRRGYKIVCNEINVHKQECRVRWITVDTSYRGTVTVFGVYVARKVAWHTPYTVKAVTCSLKKAAVHSRPACQVRTFRG